MVWDKAGSPRKLIIGVIISIILVFLIIAGAIFTIYYFGLNVTTTHPFPHSILIKPAGNAMMSDEQIGTTMDVLYSRFTDLGYNVSMESHRYESGVPYMTIYYDDIPSDTLAAIVTTPGIFEMRIQTSGNESEHVFFGDGIYDVQSPQLIPTSNSTGRWGVHFSLSNASIEEFKHACIDSGATLDPANHTVMMLLDDKVIYAATISPYLAQDISTSAHRIEGMIALTGTGDSGKEMARNLSMCLRSGALPVKMEVVSPVKNLSYTATVPLS